MSLVPGMDFKYHLEKNVSATQVWSIKQLHIGSGFDDHGYYIFIILCKVVNVQLELEQHLKSCVKINLIST